MLHLYGHRQHLPFPKLAPESGINPPHTASLDSAHIAVLPGATLRSARESSVSGYTPMQHLQHSFRWISLLALLLAVGTRANAVTRGALNSPNVAEQLLLTQANQDRSQHNLSSLKRDPMLAQAALYHAYQMAEHADISHGFPGEPDLSARGASAGVRFSLITENVAEAGEPTIIHDMWMHSEGHRANLLDPEVNVVGIAVVTREHQVYAVEDFASTVDPLSIDQQETAVATLLSTTGLNIANSNPDVIANARQTCGMSTGYAGVRQPWFIMRYTASRLDQLPQQLKSRLTTGKYHQAVVGACSATEHSAFSSYNIAILLYP